MHAHPEPAAPSAATRIRMTGPDALDVLHRISTQALTDLEPGRARATLFCDFRGRLLHRAVVARTRDGVVWLLRDDAPAAELIAHVDRHVFREKVAFEEPGAGLAVRPVPGGFGHAPGHVEERNGAPRAIQLEQNFGWSLEDDATPADHRFELDRIGAGRPRHGHEIREAFTPYEVGLAHEVHLSKGCYTGQEVLLRLVTYSSVRRRLVRLTGEGPAPRMDSALLCRGERAGVVTSVAPLAPVWTGLAVLRRDALDPPVPLELEHGGTTEPPVPFDDTRPLGMP